MFYKKSLSPLNKSVGEGSGDWRIAVLRKIVVLEHITLDGVIQGPGGPDEDTSGGFSLGGWIGKYSDPLLSTTIRMLMNQHFDLLLGRMTYEIWAPYWPHHPEVWPNVNPATKYVASNTMKSGNWQPNQILNGEIAEKIAGIKKQQGPDLHVWGSGNLMQTLLKHDLVDSFWLMIYPLTLGVGKRLFTDGTIPVDFTVAESKITPSGVIVVKYERT